jgi:hypothetical protein
MSENQEISAEEAKLLAAAQIQDAILTKEGIPASEQTRKHND